METLLEDYKRKLKTVIEMLIDDSVINETKARLSIKKGMIASFIVDIERAMARQQQQSSANCAISVIHWVLFSVRKPPDIVKEYITIDSVGDFAILEWYEGESFECCSDGHWSDEYGDNVTNVILWAEKPCV